MSAGTRTKTKSRNASAPVSLHAVVDTVSTPGLSHEPVRAHAKEDHETGESHEGGDVAIGMQHREADRLDHAEDEAAHDRPADHAGAPDHHHHEGLDRDRSANAGIDAGDGDKEPSDQARQ